MSNDAARENRSQRSQSLRAFEELRAMILNGDLGAGTDHLESELAERLGMSRTPVREAALMLEAQGLVDVRPRKGLRVLALSSQDMYEIYEVLTELESLAAERAAQMGYGDDDLAELTSTISDMEVALAAEDREAWAQADDRFHTELARLGGNSRVISIVGMMANQVRRARRLTLYMRPLPVKSNEDHRRVLEAIRAGRAEDARQIHRTHRIVARGVLTDLLEQNRLKMV